MPSGIHNTTYIRRRNNLVPTAERWADDHVKRKDYDDPVDYSIDWNRVFFKKMDDLAKAEGIAWTK